MSLTAQQNFQLMEHFKDLISVCHDVDKPWYVTNADKSNELAIVKPYESEYIEQAAKNELGIDFNYEEYWNNNTPIFAVFMNYIETFQTYFLNHCNKNTEIKSHQILAFASEITGFTPELQDHNILICKFIDSNNITSFFCSVSVNSMYTLNKFVDELKDTNPYSINDQVDNKVLNNIEISSETIAKSCIHYFNHFEDTNYDPDKISNVSNLYIATDHRIEPFMGHFEDLNANSVTTNASNRYFVSCRLES